MTGFVFEDEADALPAAVDLAEANFVEGVGHGDFVAADGFGIVGHNGAAGDVDAAKLVGPVTDGHLQVVPVALVEVVVLRADVGEVETLLHSGWVPFHIASGSHVATVVFG